MNVRPPQPEPVDPGARAEAARRLTEVLPLCQADDLDLARTLLADVIDVLLDDLADLLPPSGASSAADGEAPPAPPTLPGDGSGASPPPEQGFRGT